MARSDVLEVQNWVEMELAADRERTAGLEAALLALSKNGSVREDACLGG